MVEFLEHTALIGFGMLIMYLVFITRDAIILEQVVRPMLEEIQRNIVAKKDGKTE